MIDVKHVQIIKRHETNNDLAAGCAVSSSLDTHLPNLNGVSNDGRSVCPERGPRGPEGTKLDVKDCAQHTHWYSTCPSDCQTFRTRGWL